MLIIVELVGILMAAMGIIFLLNPKAMNQIIGLWGEIERLYIVGFLGILIGAILLLAAPEARLSGVVFIFGISILIRGLLIFILAPEKIKSILSWWDKKASLFVRLVAILVLVLGALLFYSA